MNDKVRVYYDAEFTSLTPDADLISIGLVSENGNHFYAEFTDYDEDKLSPWIIENVINNLVFRNTMFNKYKCISNDNDVHVKGTASDIKSLLLDWLKKEAGDKQVQIYCDCYAYDWMLFNMLVCDEGNALNIPDFIYYIPMDLSTVFQIYLIDPDITREEYIPSDLLDKCKEIFPFDASDGIKHNSLWDAYVCAMCFHQLKV